MSSATYPDPGYNCVHWASDADLKAELTKMNNSGIALAVGAGISLTIGMIMLSVRGAYSAQRMRTALPIIVASAIALGTSIPLARLNDPTQVFDKQTMNLYNASVGTLVAPWAIFLIGFLGSLLDDTLQGRPRFGGYSRFRGDQAFL